MKELRLKVLLIEDDEEDYMIVRELLSEVPSTQYSITWAMTYEEALKATEQALYDVYLVDYRLGARDGLNFLHEMNCRGCNVPVILLTGQGSYEIDMEAMKSGAADYLVKSQINAALLERSIRFAIDRAKSEEKLRKSEEKYRRLIDTALEGIWIVDESGETVYANQRMADMLGYTVLELLERSPLTFLDESTRAEAQERLQRRAQGIGEQYDFWFRRKDGSDLFGIVNASPILGDRGEFLGSIGMVTDITERKRAENALKVSEEMMRLIIESSPIGIRICRQSRYVYVNPAFLGMFGYEDPAEIRGLPEEILFAPEARGYARRREIDRIEGRPVPLSYEAKGLKKNGEQFDISVRTTWIEYQGNPAILDFIIDVGAEKALQAKLLQTQKIHSIGTLAGGIAHDFNNILGIVLGLTELAICDAPKDSRLHSNLGHAIEAIHRGVDLVNQILTFSRRSEQVHKPLHLAPLLKEALKLIRASLPSTIEIRQRIAIGHEDDVILSDPTQIHQILLNLCSNSAHAMSEKGGVLEITLSSIRFEPEDPFLPPDLAPGDYLRLSVHDTGHGIEPSIIDNIFDPYFTTKNKGEGTGLGLGVVHGIVKTHGGAVDVCSEPGRGTTFDIFLPKHKGEVETDSEVLGSLPTGNESILLIDDELRLVDAGRQILERLGYKVVGKTSATEALDTFLTQPDAFDLVITDQTMPQKTGLELAEDILRIRPQMPLILCTGFSEIVTVQKARTTGVRECVVKPFVMSHMAQTVRRVLDESKRLNNRSAVSC